MPAKAKYNLPEQDVITKRIGQNITAARKRQGLTQEELAQKIGITQQLLSHYEVGRLKLSSDMLVQFILALKVSADELLGLRVPKQESHPKLKLMKRLYEIDELSPSQQKALLKNIDMFLKGAKREEQEKAS
jgi:transcriptional regulator with XRE-family HTH domain